MWKWEYNVIPYVIEKSGISEYAKMCTITSTGYLFHTQSIKLECDSLNKKFFDTSNSKIRIISVHPDQVTPLTVHVCKDVLKTNSKFICCKCR
jgi:hypothetical protein